MADVEALGLQPVRRQRVGGIDQHVGFRIRECRLEGRLWVCRVVFSYFFSLGGGCRR